MRFTKFFVDDRHTWFDASHPQWGLANIGSDGSNLTVTFLSMNRAKLSIRLVQSFIDHVPHFQGRFLIADNGSNAEQLDMLDAFMAKTCRFPYRILRLGQNFGVAGGRNRAFEAVETDWILSLDNDIFLIGDPFPGLTHDLATLGCHFLSVPLLNPDRETFFSFGGHLSPTLLEHQQPFLGTNCMLPSGAARGRAAEISPDGQGFLCSFLFGGASILKRDTFISAGGFDDNMFVGFEDIDFSLRLFRSGLKVGSSAVAAFVHDHPPAEVSSDRDYESVRYSRGRLYDAAAYLERKHGFRVWSDGVEEWLVDREKQQGFSSSEAGVGNVPSLRRRTAHRTGRPRIALVVDVDSWAFSNIARQIEKHLGDKYEFEHVAVNRLGEIGLARWKDRGSPGPYSVHDPASLAQFLINAPEFDLIHVFWRPFLTMLGERGFYGDPIGQYAEFLGLDGDTFRNRFISPACFTTSVYDHLYLEGKEAELMEPVFTQYTAGYTVSSPRLDRIYRNNAALPAPAAIIPDGVDRSLFYPKKLDRFDNIATRDVIVGWVGNSTWGENVSFDKKGLRTIIVPCVEQLQAEGVGIRLLLADRRERQIPHHEMVDYYASIDVLVCASEIEGTPNPVLEAMACGVPIISTDVGIVPDALGDQQRGFILAERSVYCLKDALQRLIRDRTRFRVLSQENICQAELWDWKHQTAKFDAFFTASLEPRRRAQGEVRTKICMLPFTTPSQEPSGSIRLCSASSIFGYRDETDMGNARIEGLKAVWGGEKYRHVRAALLTGGSCLTPYCDACEYRHDGPAWLLQLHLCLHAYHNGIRDDEVTGLLAQRIARYDEYVIEAPSVGIQPLPPPEDLRSAKASELILPEALVGASKLPIFLDLNTLNRCNVSCVMCPPAIKYDGGHSKESYYRLGMDEFQKLTDGVNVTSAHFVGAYAEPLLNKEIFDLVRVGHMRGMFTAITSNVMPLVPQFARKLIEAGLDMISISLHGSTKATAERIMRGSNFERVLGNIRVLQDLKREFGTNKPEIYFNFVSQLANVREIPDFISLAGELGVKYVNIIHLIDGDDVVDKSSNLINYPDLLVPSVREATRRGKELGISVMVSPAYQALMDSVEVG